RLPPAIDSGGQRRVDVVECLFGSGVSRLAQAVEDAAGFGFLASFVTEESVLERYLRVVGIGPHGFAELIPGHGGFPDFEVGIAEVLANSGAGGGGFQRLEKSSDRAIVIT